MFGHDDQSQQNSNQTVPSGMLSGSQGVAASSIDDTAGDFIESDVPTTTTTPSGAQPAMQSNAVAPTAPIADVADTDQLLGIKQQALQQLTPEIGHLEQSPEEKFRTTMMMIQASDNAALVKPAYEAAMAIPDEKARAQALLDIVNEINYFTHSSSNEAEA
jgi:hypothetical protein